MRSLIRTLVVLSMVLLAACSDSGSEQAGTAPPQEFSAAGDAATLAKGLRSALDHVDSAEPSVS